MVSENDDGEDGDEDRRGQMMVRTNDGRDGRRKILQIWSLLLLKATLVMMMVTLMMVVMVRRRRRW